METDSMRLDDFTCGECADGNMLSAQIQTQTQGRGGGGLPGGMGLPKALAS